MGILATCNRRINFFSVRLGITIGNAIELILNSQDIRERVDCGVNIINNLPFVLNNNNSRYFRLPNGNDLSMYIDSYLNGVIEGRIVLCRRSLLPEIEDSGNLTSLQLAENAGLAEITHFKYFSNFNILGVEYNFYGPKSGNIVEYFQNKLIGCIDMFRVTPVIDNTWSELLNSDRYQLSMFGFKATRNAADSIRRLNNSLGEAFDAAASIEDVEEIELIVRRRSRSRESFSPEGFCWRNLFENNFMHREEFEKLSVGLVEDGHNRTLNLLEDKLCVNKVVRVVEGRTRSLESTSVYAAISSAFEDCRDQLILQGRIE